MNGLLLPLRDETRCNIPLLLHFQAHLRRCTQVEYPLCAPPWSLSAHSGILVPLILCGHASCKFYRIVLKCLKVRENHGIHKVRPVIVHGGVCKCLSVFRQFSCPKVIACLVERDNVSIFKKKQLQILRTIQL